MFSCEGCQSYVLQATVLHDIVFLIQIRLFWVNICGLSFVWHNFHHSAVKDDSFKGPREFIGYD